MKKFTLGIFAGLGLAAAFEFVYILKKHPESTQALQIKDLWTSTRVLFKDESKKTAEELAAETRLEYKLY